MLVTLEKLVIYIYTQETRKLEFEKWAKIPHHGQNLILYQVTSSEFTT